MSRSEDFRVIFLTSALLYWVCRKYTQGWFPCLPLYNEHLVKVRRNDLFPRHRFLRSLHLLDASITQTFSVFFTFCKAGQPGTTSANEGRRVFESRFTFNWLSWRTDGRRSSFPAWLGRRSSVPCSPDAWRWSTFRFLSAIQRSISYLIGYITRYLRCWK